MYDPRPLRERFESRLRITPGCWIWTGSKYPNGYGRIYGNGREQCAHRVSYEMYVGQIPPGEGYHGTIVCHKCDNPACVNPDHLFLGSALDNMRDMIAKGRDKKASNKGETNGSARLTAEQVREIRADSRTQAAIAKAYSVSYQLISAIKRREVWQHI